MTDLDPPWWFLVLAYLYVFAPWIGLGAVAGGFLAYLSLFASARRGERVPERIPVRVGLLLLAALAGAIVSFFVAIQLNNAV